MGALNRRFNVPRAREPTDARSSSAPGWPGLAPVLHEHGHPNPPRWHVGEGIHLPAAAAGPLEVDLQGVSHGLLTQHIGDAQEQDGPGAAGGLELGRAGGERQSSAGRGASGAPQPVLPQPRLVGAAYALTCRLEMSPLMHGDILTLYFPFPMGTSIRPLSISGCATAYREENPELPRSQVSFRGGSVPGIGTKADTAQITHTSRVLGETGQPGAHSIFPFPKHSFICSQ